MNETTALINLSGHALLNNTKAMLEKDFSVIETVPITTIDFRKSVDEQISKIIRKIKTPLDGSQRITIIPPGHPTLAILTIIYMHGILGAFPSICLLERDENGDYVPSKFFLLDAQDLRHAGRRIREEFVKHDVHIKQNPTRRAS